MNKKLVNVAKKHRREINRMKAKRKAMLQLAKKKEEVKK